MTRITLHAPGVEGSAVRFRWSIDPRTDLYRRTEFSLRFPPEVDLANVPQQLWWTAMLLCLHSHWLFLQPCVVELPVWLPDGEREFWLRLLATEYATLESTRGRWNQPLRIEIHESGEQLSPPRPVEGRRWAAAFSSGKDSLAQAGLLRELTGRPLLVYVDSELPGLFDNKTPRRERALEAIRTMPGFQLVEVVSDYRSAWDAHFSLGLGYDLGVSEISDCFLYLAALLGTGSALGAPHLALAAQTEIYETCEIEGATIVMDQVMYSGVVMRALDALLARSGFRYCSLISPSLDTQVTELLWTRYRDLRPLHHSCWECDAAGNPCNHCPKCTLIGLSLLALGESTSAIGGDALAVLRGLKGWHVRTPADFPQPLTPRSVARLSFDAQRNMRIARTGIPSLVRTLLRREGLRTLSPAGLAAIRAYAGLRLDRDRHSPPPAGMRPGFFALIDPAIRDGVRRVFEEHFAAEDEALHTEVVARGEQAVGWRAGSRRWGGSGRGCGGRGDIRSPAGDRRPVGSGSPAASRAAAVRGPSSERRRTRCGRGRGGGWVRSCGERRARQRGGARGRLRDRRGV